MRRPTWDEVNDLRRLVDAATDYVLAEYGRSMKATHEEVTKGYGKASAGFSGGGVSDFDDLAYGVDRLVAKAAEAIIWGSLTMEERNAIHAVYIGERYSRPGPLDLALLEAVSVFEKRARERGLL